jgi:hypothetical protein
MKNRLIKTVGAITVAMALVQTIQAVPITGNIGFVGNVNLNTGTAATATIANSYSSTIVLSASGYIATLAPNFTPLTFVAPWTFYPGSSVAITPFWTSTLANGLSFSLSSWTATRGTTSGANPEPYVAISGVGIMSDTIGDISSLYNFTVTFADPASVPASDTFTFQASQAPVPDGGSTVMLLGAALSAVGLLRKKLVA